MKVIKSGDFVIGECGRPAGVDSFGEDLFVGDIVKLYYVDGGPFPASSISLTVVAMEEDGKPFIFGISECKHLLPKDLDRDHPDFDGDESEHPVGWIVNKVKDHSHCLDGEGWDSFGFNYSEVK